MNYLDKEKKIWKTEELFAARNSESHCSAPCKRRCGLTVVHFEPTEPKLFGL